MPSRSIQEKGGRLHGFQLWVNLPARDKMVPPRYQEIPAERIPEARTTDGKARVRVIAGEALGAKAVIDTRTPILFQHWTLQPGATVEQPLPGNFNAFAYVFGGQMLVGPEAKPVGDGQLAILGEGDSVRMACAATATEPAQVLLLGGVPLREPVARYGPFVMNTKEEIMQAIVDFQTGRMGQISR
jgi:redox-sensitive bicupin YhaK (pirin superfamily)